MIYLEHSQILWAGLNLPSLMQCSKKCLAAPHLFLPVFILFYFMFIKSLKVKAGPTYCNLEHWQLIKKTRFTR